MNKSFSYLGAGHLRAHGLEEAMTLVEIPRNNGDVVVLMDDNNAVIARGIFPPRESDTYMETVTKFEDWLLALAVREGIDAHFTIYAWTAAPETVPLKERLERFDEWRSSQEA